MYKCLIFCILFSGCSLSFNNIATEGHSSDVVDEQQSADAKVDPVLSIPAKLL
jgi:hypothetical protein